MRDGLQIRGRNSAEYFHVECGYCEQPIYLNNLRWVGGVPEVKAECEGCGLEGNFKLPASTWCEVFPPPS